MQVIDLIIKLQQLDPNMEVRIDQTADGMEMFKFAPVVFVDQVGDSLDNEYVLISHQDLEP